MNRHPNENLSLYLQAIEVMPGGVNSPVRAGHGVESDPVIVTRAKGSKVWDINGHELIDYIGSWGPALLGHAHRQVVEAVGAAVKQGLSFGLLTEAEINLANLVTKLVPGIEMVRLVCSGTEATMSALRVARGFTGRNKVLIFDGCYHGHADVFLAGGGSGMATLGTPKCPGVPKSVVADTIVVPYNQLGAVEEAVERHADDLAAIIVEPVAGNMGVVPPEPGFLEGLRNVCDRSGAILIFDEVMTGFRVAPGGAQEYYMVLPDLTTMGKILGGGMPLAAYGGRRDIMEKVAPAGPVYQAGTLAGNPLATAAALASLSLLHDLNLYVELEKRCEKLQKGLEKALATNKFTACVQRVTSMVSVFFREGPVRNFDDVRGTDAKAYGAFWRGMLSEGILLPPSAYESWFVSSAHAPRDINRTIKAAEMVLKGMASGDEFRTPVERRKS